MTMQEHHLLVFIIIMMSLSFLSTPVQSGSDSTTSFVYGGCSLLKYSPGTPYQFNLNSLLASLANAAGFSPYSNFTSSLSAGSSPVSGLYQCRFDLSVSDCESCVRSAINQLPFLCPSATGAAVQLRGCLVRYDNNTFVGKADKSLMGKRCGSIVADGNLAGMRDEAMAQVVAGTGSAGGQYRAETAGYVDASAQCVGDQGPKQCRDCVTEAAADLRAACGAAASGEVYLGKCFAQYSSRVAYSYGHINDNNDHASEAGKDIAIIIGIVAAVLLIILFLNYLKKSAEGKGKH